MFNLVAVGEGTLEGMDLPLLNSAAMLLPGQLAAAVTGRESHSFVSLPRHSHFVLFA
jgi:hypothetical protein